MVGSLRACVLLFVASCGLALNVQTADSKCDRMKAFLSSFTSGDTTTAKRTVSPNVLQHNLDVSQGLMGYEQLIESRVVWNVETFRCFETSEYTIGHSRFNGIQVCFDVYRWNKGLIAEHWDNCQIEFENDVNPHTMVDGPTEACCLDETEKNVRVIEEFQREVFVGGSSARLLDYFACEDSNCYIQHNQNITDGPHGLGSFIKLLESNGLSLVQSTKFVIGHGNFVLVASLGLNNVFDARSPPMTAAFDLYRLQDGKIREHWDTLQAIPDLGAWKNANGKW